MNEDIFINTVPINGSKYVPSPSHFIDSAMNGTNLVFIPWILIGGTLGVIIFLGNNCNLLSYCSIRLLLYHFLYFFPSKTDYKLFLFLHHYYQNSKYYSTY